MNQLFNQSINQSVFQCGIVDCKSADSLHIITAAVCMQYTVEPLIKKVKKYISRMKVIRFSWPIVKEYLC